MRLYLDDNLASPLLAFLLRNAGHDVQLPVDAGVAGKDDSVHLTHAILDNRTCLSEDHGDFANLHNLVLAAQGHHPGVLIIRRDHNPKHNLTPRRIVRAITNLSRSKSGGWSNYLLRRCSVT